MYSMSILFSNFQMISHYWNRRLLDLIPIRYQFSFNQYYDTTQTKQQCQKRNKSFPSFSIHHSTAHHKSVIKNWLQPHRALSIYLHSSAHYLTNRMDSGKKISVRNEIWQRSLKPTFEEMSNAIFVIIGNCHECAMQRKKMKWHDHDCLHLCVEQTQICTDVNKQKYTYVQINMNDLILRYHLHVVFFLFFSSLFISFFSLPIIFLLFTQRFRVHTTCLKIMQRCDILVTRAYVLSVSSSGLVFYL